MLFDHDVETGGLLVLVVSVDRSLLNQSVQFAVAQFRDGRSLLRWCAVRTQAPPSSRLTVGCRAAGLVMPLRWW
jgi:hypothetical protein